MSTLKIIVGRRYYQLNAEFRSEIALSEYAGLVRVAITITGIRLDMTFKVITCN